MFPARFHDPHGARLRFGDRVDRVAPYLLQVDPLADAVVATIESLPAGQGWRLFNEAAARGIAHVGGREKPPESFRAFFAQVERVPPWVDWKTIDRGGDTLMRSGPLGGVVLGVKSLIHG